MVFKGFLLSDVDSIHFVDVWKFEPTGQDETDNDQ